MNKGLALAGAGLGALGILLLARRAKAIPPEVLYSCPYCVASFSTYGELVDHIETEHPSAVIPPEEEVVTPPPEVPPVYKVSVGFRRERVCVEGYTDEYGNWVCTLYSDTEREGIITVVNQGAAGLFVTVIEGWFYLSGVQGGAIGGASRSWTSYFGIGQTLTYKISYMVPVTGMPLDSRFFIKVYDPEGNTIADEVFRTPL